MSLGLDSHQQPQKKEWELNDSVPACFVWSDVVFGGEASYHVCIDSLVNVRAYTEEDVCEQCGSGTQEVGV